MCIRDSYRTVDAVDAVFFCLLLRHMFPPFRPGKSLRPFAKPGRLLDGQARMGGKPFPLQQQLLIQGIVRDQAANPVLPPDAAQPDGCIRFQPAVRRAKGPQPVSYTHLNWI